MAGTAKRVRITVACSYGDVGHEFTPTGTVRDWLFERKWAVFADEVEQPARPARLASKALKKITEATKGLFKQ